MKLQFNKLKLDILIMLFGIFVIGPIIGLLLLFKKDIIITEYNKYCYRKDDDKAFSVIVSNNFKDAQILLEYYSILNSGNDSVSIKNWESSFLYLPINCKIKVIDTISNSFVKISYLLNNKETGKAFLPIFLVHNNPNME